MVFGFFFKLHFNLFTVFLKGSINWIADPWEVSCYFSWIASFHGLGIFIETKKRSCMETENKHVIFHVETTWIFTLFLSHTKESVSNPYFKLKPLQCLLSAENPVPSSIVTSESCINPGYVNIYIFSSLGKSVFRISD